MLRIPPDPRIPRLESRPVHRAEFNLAADIQPVVDWLGAHSPVRPPSWETWDEELKLHLVVHDPIEASDGETIIDITGIYTYKRTGPPAFPEDDPEGYPELPFPIDPSLNYLKWDPLVTISLHHRASHRIRVLMSWHADWPEVGSELVQRMQESWEVFADVSSPHPDPEELDIRRFASIILKFAGDGYAPTKIVPDWVMNQLPGWNKKTLERRVGGYLKSQGLPSGIRGQWRHFVAHVLENRDRFQA